MQNLTRGPTRRSQRGATLDKLSEPDCFDKGRVFSISGDLARASPRPPLPSLPRPASRSRPDSVEATHGSRRLPNAARAPLAAAGSPRCLLLSAAYRSSTSTARSLRRPRLLLPQAPAAPHRSPTSAAHTSPPRASSSATTTPKPSPSGSSCWRQEEAGPPPSSSHSPSPPPPILYWRVPGLSDPLTHPFSDRLLSLLGHPGDWGEAKLFLSRSEN
ncbi:hypothetical protein BRADI_1g27958v3 [Brachypodium distachyon]|uniref:Uncharacterized protein n=1 Tax=Brachypodium distachyon TaxID=15368 RepID=A0A2K2DLI7_BRADI|nr:hypothetical protein BRADI_1g27958v3 [Brachypodium distachyon]